MSDKKGARMSEHDKNKAKITEYVSFTETEGRARARAKRMAMAKE